MITPAKIFTDYDDFHENGQLGAIYCHNFESGDDITMMYNKCVGCGNVLPLTIGGDNHPRWNIICKNPLTLDPSIHHPGCWHGWLRNGVWENC